MMANMFAQVLEYLAQPQTMMTMLSLIIKSALVMVVSLVVVSLLERTGPAIRSLVLSLVFLSLLAMPVLIVVTPSLQVPVGGWLTSSFDATSSSGGFSPVGSAQPSQEPALGMSLIGGAVAVWLVGVVVLLGRLVIGHIIMRGLIRRGEIARSPEISRMVEHLSLRLNLSQSVRVLFSDRLSTPVAAGLWRHTVVLPAYARDWSADAMEMALTHELAHIRRHDLLWSLIASVAAAIYWFNPLVWVCRRWLVREAERACDDFVVVGGASARSYAEMLLNIARGISGKRLVAPLGVHMTRKSELEGRLMSILSERTRTTGVRLAGIVVAALVTLAFVLPLSGVRMQNALADEKLPQPDEFVKVDEGPVMVESYDPVYPQSAKEEGLEGTVWVQALVDTEGAVSNARIARSSGHEILDLSALDAAKKNKFTPAKLEDKPVATWVTYKVAFALSEKDSADNESPKAP